MAERGVQENGVESSCKLATARASSAMTRAPGCPFSASVPRSDDSAWGLCYTHHCKFFTYLLLSMSRQACPSNFSEYVSAPKTNDLIR